MIRRLHIIFLLMTVLIGMILSASNAAGQAYTPEEKKFQSWLAKRPYISKINVEGNEYFSDSRIRSHLFSRERSFWQFLKSGSRDRLLRYSVYRDTLEVKYLYVRAGFLNIKIAESVGIAEKDSSAVITVTVNEGRQFRLASVELHASDTMPFYSDLAKVAGQLKIGDPIDPFAIKAAVFDLKTIYANNGYPYASVTDIIDSSAGPVNTVIDLQTTPGPPVYFGDVVIRDLKYYSPYLARREMAFRKGSLYSREKIIESQRRLYATGLFNSISLEISKTDTNDVQGPKQADTMPNFVFGAIERSPHFISVNTGASQDSLQDLTWDFAAAWGKRNIFVSRKAISLHRFYSVAPALSPLSGPIHRTVVPRFPHAADTDRAVRTGSALHRSAVPHPDLVGGPVHPQGVVREIVRDHQRAVRKCQYLWHRRKEPAGVPL